MSNIEKFLIYYLQISKFEYNKKQLWLRFKALNYEPLNRENKTIKET